MRGRTSPVPPSARICVRFNVPSQTRFLGILADQLEQRVGIVPAREQ